MQARLALFLCHGLRWKGIEVGPIRPDHCDIPTAAKVVSAALTLASKDIDYSGGFECFALSKYMSICFNRSLVF